MPNILAKDMVVTEKCPVLSLLLVSQITLSMTVINRQWNCELEFQSSSIVPFDIEKTSVKLWYKKACINSREIDTPFKSYEQKFRQMGLD